MGLLPQSQLPTPRSFRHSLLKFRGYGPLALDYHITIELRTDGKPLQDGSKKSAIVTPASRPRFHVHPSPAPYLPIGIAISHLHSKKKSTPACFRHTATLAMLPGCS